MMIVFRSERAQHTHTWRERTTLSPLLSFDASIHKFIAIYKINSINSLHWHHFDLRRRGSLGF